MVAPATGAASKASTISNSAMKSRTWQPSPTHRTSGSVELGRPDAGHSVDIAGNRDEISYGLLAGSAADDLQGRPGDGFAAGNLGPAVDGDGWASRSR